MPKERFKVCPHDNMPGKMMVEYWRDGEFIAGIYPHEDGIRIVSKYLDGVSTDPSYPTAAIVNLNKKERRRHETIHQGRKPG